MSIMGYKHNFLMRTDTKKWRLFLDSLQNFKTFTSLKYKIWPIFLKMPVPSPYFPPVYISLHLLFWRQTQKHFVMCVEHQSKAQNPSGSDHLLSQKHCYFFLASVWAFTKRKQCLRIEKVSILHQRLRVILLV